MGGIHKITSSLFIQSGSVAHFKNGINITGSLSSSTISSPNFIGLETSNEVDIPLNVGRDMEDGTYQEWITPPNIPIRITASGDFDGFCFIENQTLTATGPTSTWRTVNKGNSNGLSPKSFYQRENGYDTPGVYEYLIIANNSSSLKTVVKGTTVTVLNALT